MIFSIILLLNLQLNLLDPEVLFGIILGGVVKSSGSPALRCRRFLPALAGAVNYIKEHIKLDTAKAASVEASKKVVSDLYIVCPKGYVQHFYCHFLVYDSVCLL